MHGGALSMKGFLSSYKAFRPILRLKNSQRIPQNKTWPQLDIKTNSPYAELHNRLVSFTFTMLVNVHGSVDVHTILFLPTI